MSNIIAGVARGNMLHFEEHIAGKKAVYERYREGFKDLPVSMNPVNGRPNYWLSSMLIDREAMCRQVRGEKEALYISEPENPARQKSWRHWPNITRRADPSGSPCTCSPFTG